MGGATVLGVMATLFYADAAGYLWLATALYLPALHR